MFCEGLSGRRRQIKYLDVLKDFGFMKAKGFDYGFIGFTGPWGSEGIFSGIIVRF